MQKRWYIWLLGYGQHLEAVALYPLRRLFWKGAQATTRKVYKKVYFDLYLKSKRFATRTECRSETRSGLWVQVRRGFALFESISWLILIQNDQHANVGDSKSRIWGIGIQFGGCDAAYLRWYWAAYHHKISTQYSQVISCLIGRKMQSTTQDSSQLRRLTEVV